MSIGIVEVDNSNKLMTEQVDRKQVQQGTLLGNCQTPSVALETIGSASTLKYSKLDQLEPLKSRIFSSGRVKTEISRSEMLILDVFRMKGQNNNIIQTLRWVLKSNRNNEEAPKWPVFT